MDIVSLVVFLVFVGLAFWVVAKLAGAFGIPAPIVGLIQVLIVVSAVIYLVQMFQHGGAVLRLR